MSPVDLTPFILDSLSTLFHWVTVICILAGFGISYFVIDRNLTLAEGKRAYAWVGFHQIALLTASALLMDTLVWNRPAFMPVIASTPFLLGALCCIIKVGFVHPRLERLIITPAVEEKRRQFYALDQEDGLH